MEKKAAKYFTFLYGDMKFPTFWNVLPVSMFFTGIQDHDICVSNLTLLH